MNLVALTKQKLSHWLPVMPFSANAGHVSRAFAHCNTPRQLSVLMDEILVRHLGGGSFALYLSADFARRKGQAFYYIDLAREDNIITDEVLPFFPECRMLSLLKGSGIYDINIPASGLPPSSDPMPVSAAIPILYQNRTIGIGLLRKRECTRYSRKDKQLLRLIGQCSGPVLAYLVTFQATAFDRQQQLTSDIKRILHDLKNPIGSILGLVEIYGLTQQDAKAVIVKAARDALHGLNQALAVLNGEQKHQTLLRFNTIVRRVVTRFTLSSIHLELNDLPDLYGNEGEMESLLDNLLKNAIEAEGIKGREQTVAVKTWYDAENHLIVGQVSDRGGGIPADILPTLWEGNRTTKTHGSGVGLSIARQIVDRYGGSITVDSIPGQGATFTFSLPAAKKYVH